MNTVTVYTVKQTLIKRSEKAYLRFELDSLIKSVLTDELSKEIKAVHGELTEQEIDHWLSNSHIENSPAKEVLRSAMASVRVSNCPQSIARIISQAHQRIMLKAAHVQGWDLSISP